MVLSAVVNYIPMDREDYYTVKSYITYTEKLKLKPKRKGHDGWVTCVKRLRRLSNCHINFLRTEKDHQIYRSTFRFFDDACNRLTKDNMNKGAVIVPKHFNVNHSS